MQIRSPAAFGTRNNAGFVLNGGALDIRRDTTIANNQMFFGSTDAAQFQPSGFGYPVTVNGSATISGDRFGTTATNIIVGLGTLTVNGSPTVQLTTGNGYALQFSTSTNGVSAQLFG